ncbi:MAG: [FeFe] hydrogenase, group A [Christensenellaceae bacterium]|nr:[FeFe] hydrogenase, group A [Christensenellaceae bacterium]MCI6942795.1 [FeFe] hydrogenase, group A [Christensenellaceae bacterium]MCI7375598.1 [FeFe] hydrogenase, group A [Christensenellaceae bacterium]
MENKEYMLIDGNPVEINGEKNLLEVIRKAGIELPTFCYHSELSVYGACRMCMVENSHGGMEAACSTVPKAGMEIYTNTERLHKHRKMILELLLANHCRDCTTCQKNGKCRLQELASLFGLESIRFKNLKPEPELDTSSLSIIRDAHKCILCGDCVRMCNEIQNVGAIDFVNRGSKMVIGPAFNEPIANSPCVGCGQCAAVCPTGAIVIRKDTGRVWPELNDKNTKVVAQVAPAVRVAMAKEFGLPENENSMGRITAALRRLGFDEVYDTATGADLTVLEESNEFLQRIEAGENLPLITSCCPAWIQYCEKNHPELMKNISTCKSPMQMFSSVIKAEYANSSRRVVCVAIMPCTAKKFECAREEFMHDGVPETDYVITTQELIQMIHKAGIVFDELEPEAVDPEFSTSTGAGVIFGVTGGVTEAVLRRLSTDKSKKALMSIAFNDVRGMKGVKETTIPYGDKEVRIAIVSGLKNAESVIQALKNGEHFDFIEVMACPGGCVAGGGQPFGTNATKEVRGKALYSADKMLSIKRSEENPLMLSLYDGVLKGRVHELLHVHYNHKEEE